MAATKRQIAKWRRQAIAIHAKLCQMADEVEKAEGDESDRFNAAAGAHYDMCELVNAMGGFSSDEC
jgi:hypothetical protein